MRYFKVKTCSGCGKEFSHGEVIYFDKFQNKTVCSMCKYNELFIHSWETGFAKIGECRKNYLIEQKGCEGF